MERRRKRNVRELDGETGRARDRRAAGVGHTDLVGSGIRNQGVSMLRVAVWAPLIRPPSARGAPSLNQATVGERPATGTERTTGASTVTVRDSRVPTEESGGREDRDGPGVVAGHGDRRPPPGPEIPTHAQRSRGAGYSCGARNVPFPVPSRTEMLLPVTCAPRWRSRSRGGRRRRYRAVSSPDTGQPVATRSPASKTSGAVAEQQGHVARSALREQVEVAVAVEVAGPGRGRRSGEVGHGLPNVPSPWPL